MSHHRSTTRFDEDFTRDEKTADDKCLDSGVVDSGFISGFLDSASNLDEFSPGATANIPRVLSDLPESQFDDHDEKTYDRSCSDSGYIVESDIHASADITDCVQAEEKAKGNEAQLKNLIEEAFAPDEDGDTSLHEAIVLGFIEVVFSLVRLAPESKYLNIKNGSGMTPLHLAVVRSQPWAIRRLVIAGCNVTSRDRHGNTALHLACKLGDVSAVRCLMQPITSHEMTVCPKPLPANAPHLPQDLELRNNAGLTCLHVAVLNGHFAVVQLLVIYGIDVNVVESASGKTALHACAEAGSFEMCKFLIDCGADLDVDTWSGRTPADLAMEAGHEGLAKALVHLGSDITPPEIFDTDDDEDSEDECEVGGLNGELP